MELYPESDSFQTAGNRWKRNPVQYLPYCQRVFNQMPILERVDYLRPCHRIPKNNFTLVMPVSLSHSDWVRGSHGRQLEKEISWVRDKHPEFNSRWEGHGAPPSMVKSQASMCGSQKWLRFDCFPHLPMWASTCFRT